MGPLFRNVNVFDLLEHRKADLNAAIERMPVASNADIESLAAPLVKRYLIHVPTLREEERYATEQDVEVEVNTFNFQYGFVPGSVTRQAKEVTIHVPFDGDASLFEVRPQQFNLNSPHGEVVDHELLLAFRFDEGSGDVKQRYNVVITDIKQHLDWLRPSADQLERDLWSIVTPALARRLQQSLAQSQALAALGIPIRTPEKVKHGLSNQSEDAGRAFTSDVFISHAHEDKQDIAAPLANALREHGLGVWYDEFSLSLGDSLRTSIDRGLRESRFGVVILSPNFFEKHWPVQELNGLSTKERQGHKVILPVWHNVTAHQVRSFSPVLADRLGISTSAGLQRVVQAILVAVKAG